jgi:hypothetical protein
MPPSVSRMSENVGASICRNPKGLHVLYRGNFTFFNDNYVKERIQAGNRAYFANLRILKHRIISRAAKLQVYLLTELSIVQPLEIYFVFCVSHDAIRTIWWTATNDQWSADYSLRNIAVMAVYLRLLVVIFVLYDLDQYSY